MGIDGKSVLVTGADGFIGSHLCEHLLRRGARVRGLCQYNSFHYNGWLDGNPLAGEMDLRTGDIRDAFFVRQLLEGVDIVFNLAALIAIPYSYIAPASYVETNVTGALNVCQAALSNGMPRVIQTSTSEVYGTARFVPITEEHPLQPQSPYSASKIGADALAMSHYHAYELPVTIARPFNTYGPRQSARAVIPTIITQIASGMRTIQLGDTSPTRDFNFVADTCGGLIAIAESDALVGQVVNIGSGEEISVHDTLLLIRALMGSDCDFVQDPQRMRPAGSEVCRLVADSTKLREATGFRPRYSLREGLLETIAWFTNPDNLQHYKAGIYNV